jgi:hypothetical protein
MFLLDLIYSPGYELEMKLVLDILIKYPSSSAQLACFFLIMIYCLPNIFLVLAFLGCDTCPSRFLI